MNNLIKKNKETKDIELYVQGLNKNDVSSLNAIKINVNIGINYYDSKKEGAFTNPFLLPYNASNSVIESAPQQASGRDELVDYHGLRLSDL